MGPTTTVHACVGKCLTLVEQASHLGVGGSIFLSVCVLSVTAMIIAAMRWLS